MYFWDKRVGKAINDLASLIYSDSEKIESYLMRPGYTVNEAEPDINENKWQKFSYNDRWGGKDLHYWFVTEIEIPEKFLGKTVYFEARTGREGQWDACNPQFLAYVNGVIVQAMDTNHYSFMLTQNAKPNEKFRVSIYAYTGMIGGDLDMKSRIVVLEKEVEKLYYNLKVPFEAFKLLDENDKRRVDILNFMDKAVSIIDFRKPFSEVFYRSVAEATSYLETEFYGNYCGHDEVVANCIGHTHIDVAWQWTVAQTREKAVRSFSTVLKLMEEYPNYTFMSSQPQLYKYVKEDKPEVYEKIKERIKEGRWEPEGAMWLEADCNVTSGESLVRQVLYGKKFFKNEFGMDSKILWLPDVFGYSAALPQILRKSGVDYFMTSKISWNETNKLPYDTFMWRGIDGTEILTHFITTQDPQHEGKTCTTYVGRMNSQQVRSAWNRYQQKDICNEVLVTFGYGDGGGGPTKDMLEQSLRLEKGIPGIPKVNVTNPLAFFKRLESKVRDNKRLPKWVGELYLELHRGTYTTMARNKKYNRKSELLLQDAELLALLSKLLGNIEYPKETLDKSWELILLNQFHDIIPGSSIKAVYEDSDRDYAKVLSDGANIVANAVNSIIENTKLEDDSIVVFNQLGYNRSDIVEVDMGLDCEVISVFDEDGSLLPVQRAAIQDGRNCLMLMANDVPSKGYKAFKYTKGKSISQTSLHASKDMKIIGNKFFDIKFDQNFNLTSIYDKQNNREVLNDRANVFQAFEDRPYSWDAWDISNYYQDKMWEVNDVAEYELVENGSVRLVLKVSRNFLDSKIIQNIIIYNHIPRIDFMTTVDWKEKQMLLKVAFPVDVHTDKASYEIQYGNVERPTHWNTSWDAAKFEVCAHKWADLSETGYGVSLLNDCKYGHDIKDSVMRLTLLKSPTWPNEDADREVHEFIYSLYPHAGEWKQAYTQEMAYSLNCPMYAKLAAPNNGSLPDKLSMVSINRDNVAIEVVKKAEDSDDIIIRVYEFKNMRSSVDISMFKELSAVHECDLMENNISEVDFRGKSFSFEIKPYEIKTYKIKL